MMRQGPIPLFVHGVFEYATQHGETPGSPVDPLLYSGCNELTFAEPANQHVANCPRAVASQRRFDRVRDATGPGSAGAGKARTRAERPHRRTRDQ